MRGTIGPAEALFISKLQHEQEITSYAQRILQCAFRIDIELFVLHYCPIASARAGTGKKMHRYRITYILNGQLGMFVVWADSSADAQEQFADYSDSNALIRTIRQQPARATAEVAK